MAPLKACIDCRAEWEKAEAFPPPRLWRPTPHPGPRCVTHWRKEKARRREVAHATRVQSVYGLDPGDYGRLYLAQGQLCAICRRATGASRKLSVDHDHATGFVRGLLCRPCNTLLGHIRDNPELALGIYRYLNEPPAHQVIGLKKPKENRETDG